MQNAKSSLFHIKYLNRFSPFYNLTLEIVDSKYFNMSGGKGISHKIAHIELENRLFWESLKAESSAEFYLLVLEC